MTEPLQTLNRRDDSTTSERGGRSHAQREASYPAHSLALLLQEQPDLANDYSFVMNQALDDFDRLLLTRPTATPSDYCNALEGLGSSLRNSVYRQLEVERCWQKYSVQGLPPTSEWPQCGDALGPFYVLEELGRGSLGRVYLCREPEVGDRQVVVKVGLGTKVEAHTLGLLHHDNIVPIHSASNDGPAGSLTICMPFMGRSTLHTLIDVAFDAENRRTSETVHQAATRWTKPTDQCARARGSGPTGSTYEECIAYILSCLADAVHHAHSRHVIHGDIKPSNVILTPLGEPLLCDFNLSGNAKLNVAPRGGTIPYVAPEQLVISEDGRWSLERPDARAEVYSLGAVAYQLLAGELPFKVDHDIHEKPHAAAALIPLQKAGAKPVRSWNKEIPRGIAHIVDRCLSHEPAKRFADPGELAEALRRELRLLHGLIRRIARRPRAAVGATLGGLCTVAAFTGWLAMRPPLHERLVARGLAAAAGDSAEAERILQQAVVTAPGYLDARFELGKIAIHNRDWPTAVEQFYELHHRGDLLRGAAYLGYARALEGQHTTAIPWLERALSLSPHSGEIANNLAVCYIHGSSSLAPTAQRERARELLRQALSELPDSPAVALNWINFHIENREYASGGLEADLADFASQLAKRYPDAPQVQCAMARETMLAYPDDPRRIADAADCLAKALIAGKGPKRDDLDSDPTWRPLRSTQRYQELCELASAPRTTPSVSGTIPALLEPSLNR